MKKIQFPTMLRQMWSGTQVQDWIDANVQLPEWQPIGTAPKDRTYILVRDTRGNRYVTRWTGFGWHDPTTGPFSSTPTHWYPLPKDPP